MCRLTWQQRRGDKSISGTWLPALTMRRESVCRAWKTAAMKSRKFTTMWLFCHRYTLLHVTVSKISFCNLELSFFLPLPLWFLLLHFIFAGPRKRPCHTRVFLARQKNQRSKNWNFMSVRKNIVYFSFCSLTKQLTGKSLLWLKIAFLEYQCPIIKTTYSVSRFSTSLLGWDE